jgi:hypothetical protein
MKHQFTLTVGTDATLQQDQVCQLVQDTLEVGQSRAETYAKTGAGAGMAFAQADAIRKMEFTLVPVPAPTTQLAAEARLFVMALDEMGFGADDPINGGDCVEFIDQHQALLRRLPALAELAGAVDTFLAARVPKDGSYSQIIVPLIAAHMRVKS